MILSFQQFRVLVLVLTSYILVALPAWAVQITSFGVPVDAVGSSTQAVPTCPGSEGAVCYDPTGSQGPGSGYQIEYFIPLDSGNNGTYGVTSHAGGTSGTFSDSGSGASSSLTMILRFDTVADVPLDSAVLTFEFDDLDLDNVNDPTSFFETVQFLSATGSPLSDLIDQTSDSSGAFLFTITSGGLNDPITITFSDVRTLVRSPDPFYVQLVFGSSSSFYGYNTPEFLTATLTTATVPEPGSMLLLGSGLAAIGFRRRFRK